MRGIDHGRSGGSGRHLRVGRLLLELSKLAGSRAPRVDGATVHFERCEDDGTPIEKWKAHGLAFRLTTPEVSHGFGWRLSVCWRGLRRQPNPYLWPHTRLGRQALRARLANRRRGGGTLGCEVAGGAVNQQP